MKYVYDFSEGDKDHKDLLGGKGANLAEMTKIGKELLPEGYRMVFSGSAATYGESNQGLIFVFVLGLFTAYMVLASQYNSFIHPFTVLLALPFSVTLISFTEAGTLE